MKKLFSVYITVLIILTSCITINASNAFEISSLDLNVDNNRLLDVPIYLKYNSDISAFTCELSFDTNYIQFRDVSTDISDGEVEYNTSSNTVKFIFLSKNGVACNNKEKLATVVFKSVNSGSATININTYDCVNSDGHSLNLNGKTSSVVNISGDNSDVSSGSKNSDYKNGKSGSTDKKKYDDKSKDDKEKEKKKKKTLSFIDDNLDREETYVMLIILLVFIIVVGAAYIVFRLNNMEAKLKNSNSDNVNEMNVDNNYIDIKDKEFIENNDNVDEH